VMLANMLGLLVNKLNLWDCTQVMWVSKPGLLANMLDLETFHLHQSLDLIRKVSMVQSVSRSIICPILSLLR
jgi:hypothetical protein